MNKMAIISNATFCLKSSLYFSLIVLNNTLSGDIVSEDGFVFVILDSFWIIVPISMPMTMTHMNSFPLQLPSFPWFVSSFNLLNWAMVGVYYSYITYSNFYVVLSILSSIQCSANLHVVSVINCCFDSVRWLCSLMMETNAFVPSVGRFMLLM